MQGDVSTLNLQRSSKIRPQGLSLWFLNLKAKNLFLIMLSNIFVVEDPKPRPKNPQKRSHSWTFQDTWTWSTDLLPTMRLETFEERKASVINEFKSKLLGIFGIELLWPDASWNSPRVNFADRKFFGVVVFGWICWRIWIDGFAATVGCPAGAGGGEGRRSASRRSPRQRRPRGRKKNV